MKNLFILALFLFSACSTSKNLVHNQQTTPFVADGKAIEWGDNLLFDPNSHILYKVSNDNNNLYIMAKISDEKIQRRLLMSGLTVCIDTTNGKKEIFEVTFPRGKMNTPGGLRTMDSHEKTPGDHEFNLKEKLVENEMEIELRTYDYTEPQVMYLGESKLKPVMDVDSSQSMVYEFALPLGYFIKNKKSTKPISIGIIIGHEKTMSNRSASRGQDETGEGGGGRHGGMGGGGGRRGGMGGGMGGGGGRHGGGGMGYGHSDTRSGGGSFEPVKVWLKDYVLNLSI